jgi:hypothetical protein
MKRDNIPLQQPRVEITRMMVGICHMQVCAVKDATDQEILEVCNLQNPTGIQHKWSTVIRREPPGDSIFQNVAPKQCDEHVGRMHFLVAC